MCVLHVKMYQGDIKLHMFVFFMRICLFTVTGIVLHATHAYASVFVECPFLWESMTAILSLKCLRITLCKVTMHRLDIRPKSSDCFDMLVHLIYFCIEAVVTSCALNSVNCRDVISTPFGGHPMIAYVNGLSCAWDGCLTLSVALFASIDMRGRRL
jgi:hypothetical protein